MSPEQMAALGLTRDPAETGVIMDVYCFPDHPPVYLTAAEYAEVLRREARRKGAQEGPDLADVAARMRGRTSRRTHYGRKIA